MQKIWLDSYGKDVAAEIDVGNETLVDLFNNICDTYPNNPCITSHDETLNFLQVKNYVNNLSYSLQKLGVSHNTKVAVILPNVMHYPISIFAILQLGAVVVNINPLYTESEIEYLLENSDAEVVIILDIMAHKLNNIYNKHKLKHVIVAKVGDFYPFLKKYIIQFVLKYIKKMPTSCQYKTINFYDLVKSSKQTESIAGYIQTPISNLDTAFIQYTGATTGKPKGAILTHKNIVTNIKQVHMWLSQSVPDLGAQIVINALPLYHIFSLTANLFTFFFAGSHNILIMNPRDIKSMVKVLVSSNFTVFNALDTLYAHLLSSPEFMSHNYPNFKYSVAGGMPARESIAKEWYAKTGVIPSNCYGLTETSPAVTLNIIGDEFDGSVGYPIPSTSIDIKDPITLESLPIGETGVIWVHGPQVMQAYWKNPDETKAVFNDGYFCTKDMGYITKMGKLVITGRQSDMIIISGFNVYPVEVENTLDKITGIKEVAVIGVANNRNAGELVLAFIVYDDGYNQNNLSSAMIIKIAKKTLANYKVPHLIIVLDSMPKTLVGKIDKKALHAYYDNMHKSS